MAGKIVRPPFVPFEVPYHGSRNLSEIKHFVFHTTEGNGTIEDLALYFRKDPEQLGIMYISEPSGRVGSFGHFERIVWHVANHNTECVGLEQIGFAATSTKGWFLKLRQLWAAAWIAAWVSQELDIPLVQSAKDRRWIAPSGFCRHLDIPDNDHTDPGVNYPFGFVLNLAKKWKISGVPLFVRIAIPKK